jgi:hypothetical protein
VVVVVAVAFVAAEAGVAGPDRECAREAVKKA